MHLYSRPSTEVKEEHKARKLTIILTKVSSKGKLVLFLKRTISEFCFGVAHSDAFFPDHRSVQPMDISDQTSRDKDSA